MNFQEKIPSMHWESVLLFSFNLAVYLQNKPENSFQSYDLASCYKLLFFYKTRHKFGYRTNWKILKVFEIYLLSANSPVLIWPLEVWKKNFDGPIKWTICWGNIWIFLQISWVSHNNRENILTSCLWIFIPKQDLRLTINELHR